MVIIFVRKEKQVVTKIISIVGTEKKDNMKQNSRIHQIIMTEKRVLHTYFIFLILL